MEAQEYQQTMAEKDRLILHFFEPYSHLYKPEWQGTSPSSNLVKNDVDQVLWGTLG